MRWGFSKRIGENCLFPVVIGRYLAIRWDEKAVEADGCWTELLGRGSSQCEESIPSGILAME